MKKVFVTGTTGAQGIAIAAVLKRSGLDVSGVSRNPQQDGSSVNLVKGDLENQASLVEAMADVDAVVLTLPMQFDGDLVANMTKNIVAAAKQTGIKKIVFNTSIPLGGNKTGYAAIDVKHDALAVLESSGLDIVTLMPTIYLDNLASPFLKPVINEHGIVPYPLAADFTFSWTSLENLGRYCLDALTNDSLIGKKVVISNRDDVSGSELAKVISTAAGKTLHYLPSSPDDFEQNLKPVLGEYVAKEISNLYRGIEQNRVDFQNTENLELIQHVKLQSTLDWAKQANF